MSKTKLTRVFFLLGWLVLKDNKNMLALRSTQILILFHTE